MSLCCDEGVIIDAISFKESDQILTVFTERCGVIKLIAKKAKKGARAGGVSPLSRGEFRYTKGRGELCRCSDIHIIDSFLSLRSSFDCLTAAGVMVKTIGVSQMVGKPAPKLYQLLLCYLKNLSKGVCPSLFGSSFILKIFKHEGIWPPSLHCHTCYKALEEGYFHGSEIFCWEHAPSGSPFLSREEIAVLAVLTEARSLETLKNLKIEQELAGKIRQLFDISFRKTMAIN